jgi:peptide/nickel transport system substrate-binding protein
MYRFIIVLSIFASFLSSCSKSEKEENASNTSTEAKGGRFYGGVLKLNETEYIKSLYPPSITDAFSFRVASQIYEGLLKFDQSDLSLKKTLIEDYSIDSSGTVYTFKLRKGIKFHDDPCFPEGKGRELNAADVKYCFTQLCIQSINNQGFVVFKGLLKGADKYYAASANGKEPSFDIEGLRLVNDYIIKIELTRPSSIFLYDLARPFTLIYPKEAKEKYGLEMRTKAVGTGPFTLSHVEEDLVIILKKNPNYYGSDQFGNKLPFLEAIDIKFIREKKSELYEFKKGNLDMIYRLPAEHVAEILESTKAGSSNEYSAYQLQQTPEMATQFYTFNNKGKVFSNKNLRKAISFAIDRQKIFDFVLNREGFSPGHQGIVPPAFKQYPVDSVDGYSFNLDSAKFYLARAGYAEGKGFPNVTLELNSDGERNSNVAIEVVRQLKQNLNITIEMKVIPFSQLVENIITGKSEFYRIGWLADFPNPENFLSLFYGKDVPANIGEKSFPNFSRYTNAKYDELFEKALSMRTPEEATPYFFQAEKILVEDAPVVVLWYDMGLRLLQSHVKNFPNNAIQFRDYSEVYLEKTATLNGK